jgi:membrane protein implicated in regulation of membrane protease activity
MPVFLERFVLPILAASVITVILLNPFKWDWQQRLSLFLGVFFVSYFFAYTTYKVRQSTSSPPPLNNQQATGSPCSNVSAGKDAEVNCSPSTENKDAPQPSPNH